MAGDPWDPERYERFRSEREAPFYVLLDGLSPAPGGTVCDLGCGTGKLTAVLHRSLGAARTLGLDTSRSMLADAATRAGGGLGFVAADIARPPLAQACDVVASNAALHWLPDHPRLLAALYALVAPGGQLAVQVPSNDEHPSHRLAREVAREEPFATALNGFVRETPVLAADAYAALLDGLGAEDVRAETRVFEHELPNRAGVVAWIRGTTLTAYERRLSAADYARFLARYEERLFEALPDDEPFQYPFQRTFLWARRAP